MWPCVRAAGLALLLLCAGAPARAQKATERYIPIGRSPGVSQKYASIGTIDSVSLVHKTITIAEAGASRTIAITNRTRIWLDRSKLRQPSLTGRFEDLRVGRKAEIKYVDPKTQLVAEWIKVEATGP
jgi:hypothetical protein